MTDPISAPILGSIPGPIRDEIAARLAAIEAREGVRFVLAVESGSRAWGFPSPDSDYDVRFVYVRPRDWYLGLQAGRDVIEQPITDEIDLNGWDIRKALLLLLKNNSVISEWLCSPIRYRPDDPAAARMAALADQVFDPRRAGYHYAHLGRAAVERWPAGDDPVPVKRYFYALRPALAIRALRMDPTRRPAMNLQALISSCDLPEAIVATIAGLVVAKQRTNERDNASRQPALEALIHDELGRAAELPERRSDRAGLDVADRIFLDLVNGETSAGLAPAVCR